jgi:predicted XRE-type DNA-binding protein
MKRKRDYEETSGNVFADLGFTNSKQELLKAKLTVEIYKLLKKRGATQNEAAKLLGTTQAQVSALMRCKPVSVSVGRLMGVSQCARPGCRGHREAVARPVTSRLWCRRSNCSVTGAIAGLPAAPNGAR